ncbi:acyl carrier protein [Streptomyces roseirectus]|uniref:Acyl carrier protein n=1 Tax=Streptomyces roseirectus TaxID=2768066 RepID=A0A7H0IL28_9ACTN|nr:acyl carrier protein [Streptomyces roseirectus]QNP73494.1 acyl carrier protein [Streptomyces roseirectus]
MPRKPRLTALAALLLAAGALAAPTASAKPAADRAYTLTVTTTPATTNTAERYVDVTGTVTKADGTPAAGIPVTLRETLLFTTWNPWGDPIDPTYYETHDIGTPVTDATGTFTVPDVAIDHTTGGSLLNVQPRVRITASFDEDGDPNTPQDGYYADTTVNLKTRPSSVSYQVNKKKVKTGDILTVQGKVTLPKGVEPEGTEVFLQTYWEGQYRVKVTAEEDGFFVMSVRVRGYDGTFALRTAPTDLYITGAHQTLPITNTSLPRP